MQWKWHTRLTNVTREQVKKKNCKSWWNEKYKIEGYFLNIINLGMVLPMETSRVGENHVSEELQQKADKLGLGFEHLATTIGTVVHGIDLKKINDEIVEFLRKNTFKGNKLFFFRNQRTYQLMNILPLVNDLVWWMHFHLVDQVRIHMHLQ